MKHRQPFSPHARISTNLAKPLASPLEAPAAKRQGRKRSGLVGNYNTPGHAFSITISGNYAYMSDGDSGLQIINISNPSNPILAGSYNTPGSAVEMTISGNYAYVADWDSGLQIINISDLSNPSLAGSYDTLEGAESVAVSGNYAYVTDRDYGLQIINISNPSNPILAGSYNMPQYAEDVTVSGDYAYLADGGGLQIINISNPSNPTLAGSYQTPYALGIAVSRNYAYVADFSYGLLIINISDPTNPTLVGGYNTPGVAREAIVSGDYAYVACGTSGLQIIDISNPSNPILASSYKTGFSEGIAVSGHYAYVANGGNGLHILSIAPPRLVTNELTIREGRSRILTTGNLDSLDADDGPVALTVTVSNVTGGQFEFINDPGISITQFTQRQVENGRVQFVHDGSEAAPTYDVSLFDGLTRTQPAAATITFIAINDAPVLSSNTTEPLMFTEKGPAVAVAPLLSISDADTTDLASARVSISGYIAGEDVLSFTEPASITGHFDAASGVLTLNGSARVARYQTALRSVMYHNGLDDPTLTARTIAITVNDGITDSDILAQPLTILAVNDVPVLSSNTTEPLMFTEKGPAVAVAPLLSISDADTTDLASARVSISGYVAGEDVLSFTEPASITADFDTTSGVLTLNGTASAAEYQTALGSVMYQNDSDNPSLTARTIAIIVNDGVTDSDILAQPLTILAVNDAPYVINPLADQTVTVNQPFQLSIPNSTFLDPDNTFSQLQLSAQQEGQPLPEGLHFDAHTGILSGQLAEAGSLALSITAQDPQQAQAHANFLLTSVAETAPGTLSPWVIAAASVGGLLTVCGLFGAAVWCKRQRQKAMGEVVDLPQVEMSELANEAPLPSPVNENIAPMPALEPKGSAHTLKSKLSSLFFRSGEATETSEQAVPSQKGRVVLTWW